VGGRWYAVALLIVPLLLPSILWPFGGRPDEQLHDL
jgi:hypothetical protein